MKSFFHRRLLQLEMLFATACLLLINACGNGHLQPAFSSSRNTIDGVSGVRRIGLPFAVRGDSGFLFDRDILPVLAKNGLISLNDSVQWNRIRRNDTAGKFYRCENGKFCCLLRWPDVYFGYLRLAVIETRNGAASMSLSDEFPSACEFWPTDWRSRFSKFGPFLSVITDVHGAGFNAEWIVFLNSANLQDRLPQIPHHVWNAFSHRYQSLSCETAASDTGIDCHCLLEADSDWFDQEEEDWKPDRRQSVVLPFRRRGAGWQLIDSSGWKELDGNGMLER